MFVRATTEIPMPFTDVEDELLRRPADWLPVLAKASERWGAHLLGAVGFGVAGARVRKSVRMDVGAPVLAPGRTLLPLRWSPASHERLFPRMEADLEIAALGEGITQLSISGRYEPPLGSFGQLADRALMHRVAEATVRDFVQRVSGRIRKLSHRAG